MLSPAPASERIEVCLLTARTRVTSRDKEDVLLNVARHGTANHVERQVRAYRRVKSLEGSYRAATPQRS